jgi:hypothetical protein
MHKYFLFVGLLASVSTVLAGPPPVNNAIPPCDNSSIEGKPPCSIDSNGVITAPKTPDETNGAIITPEKPTEGYRTGLKTQEAILLLSLNQRTKIRSKVN